MKLGLIPETHPGEKRIALLPANVKKLTDKGWEVVVPRGLARHLFIEDESYAQAGARLMQDPHAVLKELDVLVKVRKPTPEEIKALRAGTVVISFLDAFRDPGILTPLRDAGTTAISLEMIPRTTIAQKMDALSSQANLAGYVSVLLAAQHLSKVIPMMMTPAGTIAPARFFIVGAGVAGLQAIATAKRLGARVEAFDTRPVVEEQVKSLGAKFVKIDIGETGQTKDGYAKPLTEEQLKKQREGMAKICAQADVVITTAQVFGRRAPLIITKDMIAGIKPGSVIVDMAVESGGNVEGVVMDQVTDCNGVTIIGFANLPSRVALDASQMFANNITAFLEAFWKPDEKRLDLDLSHEILRACVVTRDGELVNPKIQEFLQTSGG